MNDNGNSPGEPEEPVAAHPRYQVGPPLGHGGLGDVFRAWDTSLQRQVALKRLSPAHSGELASYEETLLEGVHLAAVQHPNVVSVFDFGTDAEGPFLIMELVEGETLDAVVGRGAFPLEDFLSLARQTLDGLAAAHDAGLLHGDLKPANIMLKSGSSNRIVVKILDFGIASNAAQANQVADGTAPAADALPTIVGTVGFLAPEQFEKGPATVQSDLYCLGCIFYYSLTGLEPFRGKTENATIASHLEHNVEHISKLRADLPPGVSGWVMRLIERQPADRPNSAADALTQLWAVLDGLQGVAGTAGMGAA